MVMLGPASLIRKCYGDLMTSTIAAKAVLIGLDWGTSSLRAYLFDAAGASGIPVLLSRTDTENTVIALEGIFDKTRFHGERKLERMSELLAGTGLFEALA